MMEVFVTSVFGRTVSYIIDEDCTVAELKSLYAQEFETSCSSWYLMFEGKFLQNPFRLIHYNIRHGATIHVTYRHAHRMAHPVELRIVYTVRDSGNSPANASSVSNRRTSLMYVEADWSLGRVKREFAKIREIKDWKSYQLYLNGVPLKEKYLLADYYITNDATLHFEQKTRSRKFGIASLKKYISASHFFAIKPIM